MNVKCQARWLCNRSNAVGWTKDNHLETNSKRANFFGGWPSPKIIPDKENISGRDGEVGLVGRAVALLWFRGFADKGEMEMLGEQTSIAEIKATKGEHEQTKTGYCDLGELFELELCEVLVLVDCFQKSTPSNCGRDLVISRLHSTGAAKYGRATYRLVGNRQTNPKSLQKSFQKMHFQFPR